MSEPSHILISQIKNIGDVILCLPTATLIKQAFPNCKVSLLAQPYTHPVAKYCPDIDNLIDWRQLEKKSEHEQLALLKRFNFSAILHLANNKKIAKLAYKAELPSRIGTSQRLYHWRYCNKTINQARRHSRLHELQLNAQMLTPLGISADYSKVDLIKKLKLELPSCDLPSEIKAQLSNNKPKVILHPGSHGHGREWPLEYYQSLAALLNQKGMQVIFTGSPAEQQRFSKLTTASPFALNTMAKLSLEELMVLLGQADAFVSSGTGPLHIAAALNKPAIGLFPPRKGISPRRWGAPGLKASSLMHSRKLPCLSCRESIGCQCMAKISVEMVASQIESKLSNES